MHQVPIICRDMLEALPHLRAKYKLANVAQLKEDAALLMTEFPDKAIVPFTAFVSDATFRNVLLCAYQTACC